MAMELGVRVAYVKFLPYLDVKREEDRTVLTGITGGLMMLIIEALKLNATFVEPADGAYGVQLPNGSWSGKMGMLVRNEADISPGPLMVTTSRTEAANPSFPISYIDVVIFAGRPFQFSQEVFGLFTAFSQCVWFATALSFLATWIVYIGTCMASAAANFPGIDYPDRLSVLERGKVLESLDMLSSSLLSQGSSHVPLYTSQRNLVAMWLLSLIVLRTSFIGQTKASLVVRADASTIESIEDIARDDRITPFIVKDSGFLWLIETTKTDVFQKVLKRVKSRKAVMDKQSLFSVKNLQRILRGEAAMIFTPVPISGEMKSRCGQLGNMDGEFYYAPRLVAQLPISMFMRKQLDPRLRTSIEEKIKLFIERGLVHKLFRDSGLEETPCRRESALSQQLRANTRSQMDRLKDIFLIWLAGLSAASLSLLAERLYHRWFQAGLGADSRALTVPGARHGPRRFPRRRLDPIRDSHQTARVAGPSALTRSK